MRALFKASTLLVTGCVLAGALVACAPYEAYMPEDPNAEVLEKLTLPENVSDELGELLVLAMLANPVAVFGDQVKDKEVSQNFINLFNLTGHGAIEGISSKKVFKSNSKEDGTGNDQFDIHVNVFARGAGLNRNMKFVGTVSNDLVQRTAGFVELKMMSEDDKIEKFVDCQDSNDMNPAFKEGLKKQNAYAIKAFAACIDKSCDTVVVKLQLQNNKDVMTDSRAGFSFVDKLATGSTKRDELVPLTLTGASLPEVASYEDADANKKAEKLKGNAKYVECLSLAGKKGELSEEAAAEAEEESAAAADQSQAANQIPELNSSNQPREGEVETGEQEVAETTEQIPPEVQADAIDEMINEAMKNDSGEPTEDSVEDESVDAKEDNSAEESTEESEDLPEDETDSGLTDDEEALAN